MAMQRLDQWVEGLENFSVAAMIAANRALRRGDFDPFHAATRARQAMIRRRSAERDWAFSDHDRREVDWAQSAD